MPKVLGLARKPFFLAKVPRLDPRVSYVTETIQAAMAQCQAALDAFNASPTPQNQAAYQASLQMLQNVQLVLSQQQEAAAQSGRVVVSDYGTTPTAYLNGPIDQSIVNRVWAKYQSNINVFVPGDQETQQQGTRSKDSADAIYNAAIVDQIRAMALTQPVTNSEFNLPSAQAVALYQNQSETPQAVYIRGDSPNQQVTALWIAGGIAQCNALQAQVASYASPFDAGVVLNRNQSVFGAVRIAGNDLGAIVVTAVPLTGRTAFFGNR